MSRWRRWTGSIAVLVATCLLALCACTKQAKPTVGVPILDRCFFEHDCREARLKCLDGDAAICASIGSAWANLDSCDVPYDSGEARETHDLGELYLVRACQLNLRACAELTHYAGLAFCHGDHRRAAQAESVACGLGYAPACYALANSQMDGVDVPYDAASAARLFVEACDADDRGPTLRYAALRSAGAMPDPMWAQVQACVAAERMTALGFIRDESLRPRTTPEMALRLAHERSANLEPEADLFALHIAHETPDDKLLALLRDRVKSFGDRPEARAAAVRKQRAGEVRICGPIHGACR